MDHALEVRAQEEPANAPTSSRANGDPQLRLINTFGYELGHIGDLNKRFAPQHFRERIVNARTKVLARAFYKPYRRAMGCQQPISIRRRS